MPSSACGWADGRSSPAVTSAFLLTCLIRVVSSFRPVPLSISAVSPADVLQASARLTGAQAIQVVFSGPVIALGQDFTDGELPSELWPFQLSPWDGAAGSEPRSYGKLRWVTTFIARFDPDGEWPTDLKLRLAWNGNLTAWDGAVAAGFPHQDSMVTTDTLSMEIAGVHSAAAANATGSVWHPNWASNMHEKPPDGVISLMFPNGEASADLLPGLLQVREAGTDKPVDGAKVSAVACPSSAATWGWGRDAETHVCVSVSGLAAAANFSLTLPSSSKYHPRAGLLSADISLPFTTLRPFTIPLAKQFVQKEAPAGEAQHATDWSGITMGGLHATRLRLLLPHGLQTGTNETALEGRLRLREAATAWGSGEAREVPLIATILDKAFVVVSAALKPGRLYELAVLPDGPAVLSHELLGSQPLGTLAAGVEDSVAFTMGYVPNQIYHQGATYIERDALESAAGGELSWPVFAVGSRVPYGGMVLGATPVLQDHRASSSQLSITQTLQLQAQAAAGRNESLLGGKELAGTLDLTGAFHNHTAVNESFTLTGFSMSNLFQSSDHVLVSQEHDQPDCGDWCPPPFLLGATHAAAAMRSVRGRVVVWVWDLRSGKPVVGARVQWHTHVIKSSTKQAEALPVVSANTTKHGAAILDRSGTAARSQRHYEQVNVLLPDGSSLFMKPGVDLRDRGDAPSARLQAFMTLDRAVVGAGQDVHVLGYVRELAPGKIAIPPGNQAFVVKLCGSARTCTPSAPLHTDPTFGSFNATFSIDAHTAALLGLGQASVQVLAARPAQGGDSGEVVELQGSEFSDTGGMDVKVGSASFVLANPRPATGELKVTLPEFATPGSNVKVQVTVLSLLGVPVGGTQVTLTWAYPEGDNIDGRADSDPEVLTATTDGNGTLTRELLLPETGLAMGEVRVSVEWVGMTGERVVYRGRVPVQWAPHVVTVSASVAALPGQRFGVLASVVGPAPIPQIQVFMRRADEGLCRQLPSCEAADLSWLDALGTIQLSPAQQDGVLKSATQVCANASAVDVTACRWSLPAADTFALIGCTAGTVGGVERACSVQVVGRSAASWQRSLFAGAGEEWPSSWRWKLPEGSDAFDELSDAVFEIENPVHGATLDVVWASHNDIGTVSFPDLDVGLNQLAFPIHVSCGAGCSVVGQLHWPRLPANPLSPLIPLAPGFDPLMPGHAPVFPALDLPVRAQPPRLGVQVTAAGKAAGAAVAPGGEVEVSVSVEACSSGAASCGPVGEDVEVLLVAVDKAWLSLRPLPLLNVSRDVGSVGWAPLVSSVSSTMDYLTTPGALAKWAEVNRELLRADPWVPLSDLSRPLVDVLADRYEDLFPAPSTLGPRGGPRMSYVSTDYGEAHSADGEAAAAPTSADASRDARSPQGPPLEDTEVALLGEEQEEQKETGQVPRLPSAADIVPLFRRIVIPKSEASASLKFAAPRKLGTFVVRAYAAAAGPQSAAFGAQAGDFVVRRAISLTPAVPRLLRLGDNATVGVAVTLVADTPEPTTVSVGVSVTGAAVLRNTAVGQVELSAEKRTAEIRFSVHAKAMGEVQLRFEANSPAGNDAVGTSIMVQAPQGRAHIASSFVLRSTANWTEGLAVPEALNGIGDLSVTARVSKLPVQIDLARALLEQAPHEAPSFESVDWPLRVYATVGALAPYGDAAFAAAAAPGETDTGAKSTMCHALKGALQLADRMMQQHSADPGLGLQGLLSWGLSEEAKEPDAEMNLLAHRYVSWAEEWAQWLPGPIQKCFGDKPFGTVSSLAANWLKFGSAQLLRTAFISHKDGKDVLADPLSLGLLWSIRGDQWDFRDFAVRVRCAPGWSSRATDAAAHAITLDKALNADSPCGLSEQDNSTVNAVVEKIGFDSLVARHAQMTPLEEALFALTLRKARYARLITTLDRARLDTLRIMGQTAFVVSSPGSHKAAPDLVQAMALMANVHAAAIPVLVNKQANYVERRAERRRWERRHRDRAVAALALAHYDMDSESAEPDLKVAVGSGATQLLASTFNPGSAMEQSARVPWSALASPPQPVTCSATGSGLVSVVLDMSFIPKHLPRSPRYRGIFSTLVVRAAHQGSKEPRGPPVAKAAVSTLLHVTLQVTTPDTLPDTRVTVEMPAGLEPLDPNLDADAARQECQLPWYARGLRIGGNWGWDWHPSCARAEVLPANVTWRMAELRAGTHEFAFLALATSPGTYTLPPAIAQVESQPELMGTSAAGVFVVCSAADCAGDEEAGGGTDIVGALKSLRACPNGCSSSGECDLLSGLCTCDVGYNGTDCSNVIEERA